MITKDEQGNIHGLQGNIRPPSHPNNIKVEDELCNATSLSRKDADMICQWCDKQIEENEA